MVGPIKAELGLSDVQVSLLGGPAFALFYTILGIPIGRLVDRRSRRLIISIGILIWSAATFACGLARTFALLFMARIGVGVGEAALSPGAYSMIADYFPPDRLTRPTSFYLSGVWFGTGLAFIMGGFVIDMVGTVELISVPLLGDLKPWQLVFMAVAMPGLIFPLIMLTVKEPIRRNTITRTDGDETKGVSLRQAVTFIWQHRKTYAPLFTSLGLYAAYGLGTSFWTIEFFIREFGAPRANVSYVYGLLSFIFGTCGSLSAGWVADRLERRGVKDAKLLTAVLGMACMVPVAVLFPLMPSMTLAAVCVAGIVFLTPFPYGPAVAAIQVVTPNEMRGFVSALYLFVAIVLGLGLGPTLIAMMTDYVFQGPELLPLSLVAAGSILVPLAAALMQFARAQFRRSLRDAEVWTERMPYAKPTI